MCSSLSADNVNAEGYQFALEFLKSIKDEFQVNEEERLSKMIRQYKIDSEELESKFTNYKNQNEKELSAEFKSLNGNFTSVRGFKNSGNFSDLAQAKARANYIRDQVEPALNVYVCPVGKVCAWDPSPDAIQDQHYQVDALNELMTKYKENMDHKNEFFNKMVNEKINEKSEDKEKKLKEALAQRLREKKNQRSGKLNEN